MRTLLQYVRDGRLPAVRVGRAYRVLEADWLAFTTAGRDDLSSALRALDLEILIAECVAPFGAGRLQSFVNSSAQVVEDHLRKSGGKVLIYPDQSWRNGLNAAAGVRTIIRSAAQPVAIAILLPAHALTAVAFEPLREFLMQEVHLVAAAELHFQSTPPFHAALFIVAHPRGRVAAWSDSTPVIIARLGRREQMGAVMRAVRQSYGRTALALGTPYDADLVLVDRSELHGRLEFEAHDPSADPKALFPNEREWRRLEEFLESARYGVAATRTARRTRTMKREPLVTARFYSWEALGAAVSAGEPAAPDGKVIEAASDDLVAADDVIVNPMIRCHDPLRAILVPERLAATPAVVSNALIRLRLKPEFRPLAIQIERILNAEFGERFFAKTARGATFRKTALADLLAMPFPAARAPAPETKSV